MPANTSKHLSFTFPAKLQAFMTVRTTCIGALSNVFLVAAGTILTDEHAPIFIIYFKHEFAAVWTFRACHIVMLEFMVAGFDFLNNFFRVIFNLGNKFVFV